MRRRLLLIVSFALFSLQAGGMAMAIETTCLEHCEDDGPDGDCSPTCQDCVCCAQPRVMPTRGLHPAPVVAPTLTTDWPAQAPPHAPDPNEILRVPKRAAG